MADDILTPATRHERIHERLYWAVRLGHKVKSKAGRKWAGFYAEDVSALREQLRVEKKLSKQMFDVAELRLDEIRRLTDALREADCLLKYSRFRRGKAAYKIVRSALAEMKGDNETTMPV